MDSPNTNVGREVKRGPVLMSPGGNLTSPKKIDIPQLKDEEVVFAFSSKETSNNIEITEKLADLNINENDNTNEKEIINITTRQLFGSAISINLPSSFEDVSIIRQVRINYLNI
jgi:hypothetical protein